jgi:hypothetical protein
VANIVKHQVEFPDISRGQLSNKDPYQEIDSRLVKMVEKILLDPSPARAPVMSKTWPIVPTGFTYWLSIIIVVFSRGISS